MRRTAPLCCNHSAVEEQHMLACSYLSVRPMYPNGTLISSRTSPTRLAPDVNKRLPRLCKPSQCVYDCVRPPQTSHPDGECVKYQYDVFTKYCIYSPPSVMITRVRVSASVLNMICKRNQKPIYDYTDTMASQLTLHKMRLDSSYRTTTSKNNIS